MRIKKDSQLMLVSFVSYLKYNSRGLECSLWVNTLYNKWMMKYMYYRLLIYIPYAKTRDIPARYQKRVSNFIMAER